MQCVKLPHRVTQIENSVLLKFWWRNVRLNEIFKIFDWHAACVKTNSMERPNVCVYLFIVKKGEEEQERRSCCSPGPLVPVWQHGWHGVCIENSGFLILSCFTPHNSVLHQQRRLTHPLSACIHSVRVSLPSHTRLNWSDRLVGQSRKNLSDKYRISCKDRKVFLKSVLLFPKNFQESNLLNRH